MVSYNFIKKTTKWFIQIDQLVAYSKCKWPPIYIIDATNIQNLWF